MKLAFPQHAELSTSLRMRRPCPPHAENRCPQVLRTRNTNLRMRRRFSARGTRISTCGDVSLHAEQRCGDGPPKRGKRVYACGNVPPHAEHRSPHAEHESPHVETILRTRKRFSACGSTRHAEDNEKSAVLGFRTNHYLMDDVGDDDGFRSLS